MEDRGASRPDAYSKILKLFVKQNDMTQEEEEEQKKN